MPNAWWQVAWKTDRSWKEHTQDDRGESRNAADSDGNQNTARESRDMNWQIASGSCMAYTVAVGRYFHEIGIY